MLLVEEIDTKAKAWDDPIVSVHRAQLSKLVDQAAQFQNCGWKKPGALDEAVKISAQLCESSRETVFRIHRVTRQSVRELMDVIARAASTLREILAELKSAGTGFTEPASKIEAYALHVQRRVDLLDRLLNGGTNAPDGTDDL